MKDDVELDKIEELEKRIEELEKFVAKLKKIEDDQNAFQEYANSDELYQKVKEFVSGIQEVSISLVQRKFQIGYNASARIVDRLEEEGIVSASNGAKPRTVL